MVRRVFNLSEGLADDYESTTLPSRCPPNPSRMVETVRGGNRRVVPHDEID